MRFRTADVLDCGSKPHHGSCSAQSHLTNKHSKTETESMCTAAL